MRNVVTGGSDTMNFARLYLHPFFARRKPHFCPKCKTQMDLVKCSKIVHPKSEEAVRFDFDDMIGTTKFIWDEFLCPKCGHQISIEAMYAFEKARKY